MITTQIPFGSNPACPLNAVTQDDGTLLIKDTNGVPIMLLAAKTDHYALLLYGNAQFIKTERVRTVKVKH